MSLPDPDSPEYRSLVLKGRISAFNELSELLQSQFARLQAAEEGEDMAMVGAGNMKELFAWAVEAGQEARIELAVMARELGMGPLPD